MNVFLQTDPSEPSFSPATLDEIIQVIHYFNSHSYYTPQLRQSFT